MKECQWANLRKGCSGYTRSPLIGQFWQILLTLEYYWHRWIMWYDSGQRPFNEWQYLKNNILKDFCQVEWLREEQRNCIKICSMEDVFAIFYASFGTSLIWWMNLNLTPSPRSWWFSSSQGHNDWTVEQNQCCINRNRYWWIKEASARLFLNTVLDLCTFAVLFWRIDLSLCRVSHLCDLPCCVYTLLRLISIARHVLSL